MDRKVATALDAVPLRNLKADIDGSETLRQKVTRPSGAVVEAAMNRAHLEPKQLADAMGISTSFLLRGFKDQEHISWQRLQRGPSTFRRALLAVAAEELTDVIVRTVIEFPSNVKESA